jgi:hypothetical protein
VTVKECAYLKNAFVATERMWAENLAKVATVPLVMLSEAPQFGTEERYPAGMLRAQGPFDFRQHLSACAFSQ